jgi:hypothetical protein
VSFERCKSIKIIGIEGHALFCNRQVLRALTAPCNTMNRANLQVVNEDSVAVACHTNYEATAYFYAVAIEKLLHKLK